MLTLMSQGGPLMWLILLNAIVATIIFLEKFFHFHRAQINTTDFLNGIRNSIRRGNYNEAISTCVETPGPVPAVVKAGLVLMERSRGRRWAWSLKSN